MDRAENAATWQPRPEFTAYLDRLAAIGHRTWWLSPAAGEELTGPYSEADARRAWAQQPRQGIWRGVNRQHVQPAHPSWAAGTRKDNE